MTVIAVDFETFPIAARPDFPPRPVGVAVKFGSEPSRYHAFGHVSGGNDSSEREVAGLLRQVWDSDYPIVFHNAKFDLQVAYEHFGLPALPWRRVHDTMFLAYLADPHASRVGLKPLAERWLGMPPDERDAVADWLWEHRAAVREATGDTVTRARAAKWVAWAPGDVVRPYACGDTDRTTALFGRLMPETERDGMAGAYDRERRVLPVFMDSERRGLRVDAPALDRDIRTYATAFRIAEDWLRRELRADGLSFDADADVASVLLSTGNVAPAAFKRTATGRLSMAKGNLHPSSFSGARGQQVASALGYRNRLATCLKMFMQPWLAQASKTGGTIHTNWNQTRGAQGGTRTGRPSTSDPNLLNLSKNFDGRDDGYMHPVFLDVPALPLVRRYVLPDAGHVWLHRDFSGQELRVMAHFEQGDLHRQYTANASLDPHEFIGARLREVAGRELDRVKVKTLNFQSLYGGGVPALQRSLRCTADEARELKAFHDLALPGRKLLVDEIKRLAWRGTPLRTWGGRLYYCEPPGADGRGKEYKLINYLIQGSAADLTKEAMLAWDDMNTALPEHLRSRFLVQVYDEINISAPADRAGPAMRELREAMEVPRLSVPMISDGKQGHSWGELAR